MSNMLDRIMEENKMTDKNPYLEMSEDVLKTHMSQISELMEKKGFTAYQFFGESLSEDTQGKLAENASLTEKVKNLESAVTTAEAGKLSPETEKLAKITIDSVVKEIKSVDEDFPINGIIDSSLTAFEKIDALKSIVDMAVYSKKAIDAVKAQVGNKPGVQGYTEPVQDADADKLVQSIIDASGVTV
jgi:hypothetical protein